MSNAFAMNRLSEYRGRPSGQIDEVFGFGLKARQAMRDLVQQRPAGRLVPRRRFQHRRAQYRVRSARLFCTHCCTRCATGAQVARIMRDRGFAPPGDHDLLTSSALL